MTESVSSEQVAEFARILNEEIRDRADSGIPFSTEAECFASVVMEMFEETAIVEDAEICVQSGKLGRANWEIAGYAFPPSEEEDLTQMSILAVHFTNSEVPAPVGADDLRRRFELARNFIVAMLSGRSDELEPSSDVAALGRAIHARRRNLRRIEVLLATDAQTQRLKEIGSDRLGDVEIACSVWDIERLSRLSDPKQEEIELDILTLLNGEGLPCLQVPEEDPAYEAYLCVVPGPLLYHSYEKYGQRLLELNVRAFLSATGKVNRGIRDTIRSQPERFFPYNNGLAMTARQVELRKGVGGRDEIVRIVGLQIVNGGQSTASVHRAWKLDGLEEQVRKVFLQGKLTVIRTEESDTDGFIDLVRSISKFANSQNAVKDDDLEANQPWHVQLEKHSRSVWAPDAQSGWYYERSRGSYTTAKMRAGTTRAQKLTFERRWPRSQVITKTDLAKCWNAWEQRPDVVSLGGQKNFRRFTESLGEDVRRPRLDETEYRRIVARVILFRDVANVVKELKDQIPAYRANVTAYLAAYLSYRMPGGIDFDRVWEKQALAETVKDVLRAWAPQINEAILRAADGRNVTEWCKKPECWTAIRSLNLSTDVDLTRYAARDGSGRQVAIVDSSDAAAISDCLALSIEEWERLVAWSMRSDEVHWKVRGIISTLRSYALDRWTRRPTAKQARPVAQAIARWRAHEGELAKAR